MKRPKFDPRDHGLHLTKQQFQFVVAHHFETRYKTEAIPSADELLLHPTAALMFCDQIGVLLKPHTPLRHDDILRALLAFRKNKKSRPVSPEGDSPCPQ